MAAPETSHNANVQFLRIRKCTFWFIMIFNNSRCVSLYLTRFYTFSYAKKLYVCVVYGLLTAQCCVSRLLLLLLGLSPLLPPRFVASQWDAPFLSQIGVAPSICKSKGYNFVPVGHMSKNVVMRTGTIVNLVLSFKSMALFPRRGSAQEKGGKVEQEMERREHSQ